MKRSRSWCAVSVAISPLSLCPAVDREGQRAAMPPGRRADRSRHASGQCKARPEMTLTMWARSSAMRLPVLSSGRTARWPRFPVRLRAWPLPSTASARLPARSAPTGSQWTHAVRWDNGVFTDLTPELTVNDNASASGINDAGHVIGNINSWTAVLWRNGVRTTLGHLGGGGSNASDINDAGQIVVSCTPPT